tara:strand:+ start:1804 stop:2004 length:201 start_codon:yes stop_codon:yes gene_type:complete
MNLEVEHGIIALLLLAILYYFYKHQSLLSDLLRVPDEGNPELKMVKGKHGFWKLFDGAGAMLHKLD